MSLLSSIGRVFLVAVNLFFLVLGLAFFAGGLFLRFGSSVLNKYIDQVKSSLQSSAAATGSSLDLSGFDLKNIFFGVSLGLIFFGLFLLMLTIFGCLGACCKIKKILIVYLIICAVLLVGQIISIVVVYGFPDKVHTPAKKQLKNSLTSDYAGVDGSDITSLGWNIIMQKIGCCGVESYLDFSNAEKWKSSSEHKVASLTPYACCKTLPSSSSSSTACSETGTATSENNYLNTGCYMKIWGMTIGNGHIIAPVLAGVGVFQLSIIFLGLIFMNSLKKNKVGPKKV